MFCITFYPLRGMGHTSTITQQSMKGSGVGTVGMAGEECTMKMEISMRESG